MKDERSYRRTVQRFMAMSEEDKKSFMVALNALYGPIGARAATKARKRRSVKETPANGD